MALGRDQGLKPKFSIGHDEVITCIKEVMS
jgi:hypothetical protein